MISGTLAVIINMVTIMALGILVSVGVVSLYYQFNNKNQIKYSAKVYQFILWTFVSLPWIVGLVAATVLTFFDSMLIIIQNIVPNVHWHHIDEFDFLSWHGVLGIFVAVFILYALTKNLVGLINNVNKIKTLVSLAKSNLQSTYLLETDNPLAFTGGYFKPKVFVTTGLLNSLSTEEIEIILVHENEHVINNDSFKKLIFHFLSSIYPKIISSKLETSMILTMEQCADHAVAQSHYDRSKIAETLLKVNKILIKSKQFNLDKSAVCYYGLDEVEQRIKYLFNNKPNKKYPVYFIFMALIVLSFFGIYFASSAHHLIELSLS